MASWFLWVVIHSHLPRFRVLLWVLHGLWGSLQAWTPRDSGFTRRYLPCAGHEWNVLSQPLYYGRKEKLKNGEKLLIFSKTDYIKYRLTQKHRAVGSRSTYTPRIRLNFYQGQFFWFQRYQLSYSYYIYNPDTTEKRTFCHILFGVCVSILRRFDCIIFFIFEQNRLV